MQWSPQQDAALKKFTHWFKNRDEDDDQVFHLFGCAGTGKTTLTLELTQSVSGRVIFAAFTGKAASVMRKKGCSGAQTLHSLLYNVRNASKQRILELEQERAAILADAANYAAGEVQKELKRLEAEMAEARAMSRKPNWELNPYSDAREAALIVVDEVSMVDQRLGEDLLSFGKPVLVLGDPAQLPPVKGTGYFNTANPAVMLTEVHRHALDNPILHLATLARQGAELPLGSYGESSVIRRSALQGGETMNYDQVLVGKNVTRTMANNAMRSRLGRAGPLPQPGEKLVCLKNNREKGFLNGTLWEAVECAGDEDSVEITVKSEEGGEPITTIAAGEHFFGKTPERWGNDGIDEFTFGYALTTHKAQGSEWPGVYVVDESASFRADRNRWLYTAITRASERLLLVR